MTWKCPDCKAENPDSKQECSCGYAYYKVMGIRSGESEEFVKKTYRYLMTVWQEDKFAHDPQALKNARERKKKINDAYEIFRKHFAQGQKEPGTGTNRARIISITAIAVLIVASVFVYMAVSPKSAPVREANSQGGAVGTPGPSKKEEAKASGNQPSVNSSGGNGAGQQTSSDQKDDLSSEALPGNPDDRAIELVKKSHVIDRVLTVDSLMKKWAADNSAKYQILGWKAKKFDAQMYLVAFSISDGIETKGFYFDVDLDTGTVRHLADYPELQKKYGIQYKK